MTKLALAALVAAFALAAGAADAAVIRTVPPPKTPTTTPATPNEPVSLSVEDCRLDMGHLRLIRPAQFEVATYDGIFVQPVCEGDESAGAIRNEGNAGGLRPIIAQKSDLVQALADQDYAADEVIGVRFGGGDTIVLYVHHYR
jgi:hypothetical protein